MMGWLPTLWQTAVPDLHHTAGEWEIIGQQHGTTALHLGPRMLSCTSCRARARGCGPVSSMWRHAPAIRPAMQCSRNALCNTANYTMYFLQLADYVTAAWLNERLWQTMNTSSNGLIVH